ncbi:MAG: HD domain-containing protein [Candidatus Saccharibacteria bacterium]|nr:HD domain-containing protein [Candidatus Saccharibacteria bacterium]
MKYNAEKLITDARNIALEVHAGQRYGDREYFHHTDEVAALASALGYNAIVVATCHLHDSVEDTEETPESLLARNMPLIVVEGVQAVSSFDGEEMEPKIRRARSHPIGHATKFCDSSRNFATSVSAPYVFTTEKTERFAKKYSDYLARLTPYLPTVEEIDEYTRSRID